MTGLSGRSERMCVVQINNSVTKIVKGKKDNDMKNKQNLKDTRPKISVKQIIKALPSKSEAYLTILWHSLGIQEKLPVPSSLEWLNILKNTLGIKSASKKHLIARLTYYIEEQLPKQWVVAIWNSVDFYHGPSNPKWQYRLDDKHFAI